MKTLFIVPLTCSRIHAIRCLKTPPRNTPSLARKKQVLHYCFSWNSWVPCFKGLWYEPPCHWHSKVKSVHRVGTIVQTCLECLRGFQFAFPRIKIYSARNLASRASTSGIASPLETKPAGSISFSLGLPSLLTFFIPTAFFFCTDELASIPWLRSLLPRFLIDLVFTLWCKWNFSVGALWFSGRKKTGKLQWLCTLTFKSLRSSKAG